jgi:hypothetical protein
MESAMEVFFTKAESVERIEEHILKHRRGDDVDRLTVAITRAVANSIGEQIGQPPDSAHADSLEAKIGRWAMRDDDIELFPIISGVISYVVTLSAAGGVAGAAAGLAVSTVQLVWTAHRKGVQISDDQAKALTFLRSDRQPKDPASLAVGLGEGWTPDRATTVLRQLAEAPAKSGLVKLAEEMSDGRWIAAA